MIEQAEELYTSYDPFAWFYQRHWIAEIPEQILSVLDKLLLPRLPAGSSILDVCCGTGTIAAELIRRGYTVTGIDGSREMLSIARRVAPAAELMTADARSFELPASYDGAISTFDSLNHVMSLAELKQVFDNVHRALRPGGLFMFDLNTEQGFMLHWQDHFAIVEDDHACILRGVYDRQEKLGTYEITMFRLVEGVWSRSDTTIAERCFAAKDIRSALRRAGFKEVVTYDAARDGGLADHVGRIFFLARRAGAGE